MPNSREMTFHEAPEARRLATKGDEGDWRIAGAKGLSGFIHGGPARNVL
jgi:hypothetical protein